MADEDTVVFRHFPKKKQVKRQNDTQTKCSVGTEVEWAAEVIQQDIAEIQ